MGQANYTLSTTLVMAKDIATAVKSMYLPNYKLRASENVLFNYYLSNVNDFYRYCKKIARASNPDLKIKLWETKGTLNISAHSKITDHYIISVNDNCRYRQFLVVRELCALYVDQQNIHEGSQVSSIGDLSKYLELALKNRSQVSLNLDDEEIDSRNFATLLAVEVMCCPLHRNVTLSYLEDYLKRKLTLSEIAESMGIPPQIFEKVFNLGYFKEASNFYLE